MAEYKKIRREEKIKRAKELIREMKILKMKEEELTNYPADKKWVRNTKVYTPAGCGPCLFYEACSTETHAGTI